jgi:tripartite-type tricarboxylate transporter receptor subunit TctC
VDVRHKAGHDANKKQSGEETMIRILLAALAAAALWVGEAVADYYPNRPIRVFTTSSAGGISDIFMRVLGEELRKSLGQPLIIENKPGAAGNIAAHICQE